MRRSAIGRMMGSADAASGWDLLSPEAILERPAGDLRPVMAEHVLAMAETICAVGLLHPVVVDRERRLLAGRHRVEAFRLLALDDESQRIACALAHAGLEPAAAQGGPQRAKDLVARTRALEVEGFRRHHPEAKVPVRIRSDLDATSMPDAARQAEVAENDVRRDFTRPEILAFTRQLRAAGYDDTPGRPKAGTKALVPALVGIVGKSRRTIMRILAEERAAGTTPKAPERTDPWRPLRRAVARGLAQKPDPELATALQRVATLLDERQES